MTKMCPNATRTLAILNGLAFAGFCQLTSAAGFQLIEQSVSGMGTAYAGGAAQAQDATTVYFNPAGMTRLQGDQAVGAVHIVVPQADYVDAGSSHLLLGVGGLGTGTGGDSGVVGVIPNGYFTHQYNSNLSVGLGINVPFGLATEYDGGWIGRYHALKSEVTTININPSIAYKVNSNLSVGAGLNAQYIDAELSNAIDFGTINALPLALGGFGGAFSALGLTPGASDGSVVLSGDDWSYGYNLGLLFDVSPTTRVGLHYRSKIKHTLTGSANFTVPGGGAIETGTGLFVDTGVSSTVELPSTLSLSLYHQVNPEWAVMADLSRTSWSSVPELRFDFANPLQPDGVTTLNWKDSDRYAIGVAHTPPGMWTYRAGIALDETPIPSAAFRTPRIPGEDRIWVAFGAGYQHSSNLTFEFGYAHLFVDDPQINKTATGEDAVRGGLVGSYDASVDIISAQLTYKF